MRLRDIDEQGYEKTSEIARKTDGYRSIANNLLPFLRTCVEKNLSQEEAFLMADWSEGAEDFGKIAWDYEYLINVVKGL